MLIPVELNLSDEAPATTIPTELHWERELQLSWV